jgi:putative transposase
MRRRHRYPATARDDPYSRVWPQARPAVSQQHRADLLSHRVADCAALVRVFHRGSANRRKSAARLARLHARVANLRADALHKATTELTRRYQTLVVEDLNVAAMIRNRHLARAIADQDFGSARRMLGYKSTWNGGRLIVASRWFPSSRTCSACGTAKTKLALSERTYRCETCGLVIDRDVNAARNLLQLAASGAESLNACGGTVRPGPAKHIPVKQEPGTALAGKTGTASGQPLAAG